jgi:hypothetical protein
LSKILVKTVFKYIFHQILTNLLSGKISFSLSQLIFLSNSVSNISLRDVNFTNTSKFDIFRNVSVLLQLGASGICKKKNHSASSFSQLEIIVVNLSQKVEKLQFFL